MSDTGESRGSSWARWTGAVEASGSVPPAAPEEPEPEAAGEDAVETDDPVAAEPVAEEPRDDVAVRLDWPIADTGLEPPATGSGTFPGDDVPTDADLLAAADAAADARRAAARDIEHARRPELLPPVPLLPAIAGRVDALDGQLRALGMRIDVLASSVGALRGALGDRIDSYADAAASSSRQADLAIDEQRRATERALGELRRSLAGTDDVLRQVSARIDEIATDVAGLVGGIRAAATPARASATESDPQLVALVDAVAAIDDRLAAIEERLAEVPSAAGPDISSAVLDAIAALDDRVGDYAAVVGAPGAAAAAMPSSFDPAVVLDAIAGLDDRLADVAGALARREPPARAAAAAVPPVSLEPLEQALAEVRTLVEVVVDTMPASSEGSGDDLAERVATSVLARLDIAALANQLADRLEQRFEVVVEGP